MTIPYYEVLAFTDHLFTGNPAGVCLLQGKWLPDDLMLQIAAENNLPETAFLIKRDEYFAVRWMAPKVEIDLCGHATLASGHVLFHHLGYKADSIRFQSKSGELNVRRDGRQLVLDFPAQSLEPCATPPKLVEGLGAKPMAVLKGRDYVAIFSKENEVAALAPDFQIISELDAQGVAATAPGDKVDFVSRYFAPAAGIPEDPVTGSTHCVLIPYWSKRLGKSKLSARQISPRGGDLFCQHRGERVNIGGYAITYSEGKLHVGGDDQR